jgi:hypothetical protein
MACVNQEFAQSIRKCLYEIIDSMKGEPLLTYVPRTTDTFSRFRYIIDFPTILFNKTVLPDDVIIRFNEHINFEQLAGYQKFSDAMLEQFYKVIPLGTLLHSQVLPIELLERTVTETYQQLDNSHWYNICQYQPLTVSFIEKYLAHIDWYALSQNKQAITCDLLNRYYHKLFWPELTKLGVSEEILEQCIDKLDAFAWQNIAYSSKLSTGFIARYFEQLRPSLLVLVTCQELTDEMLEAIMSKCTPEEAQDLWNKIANSQPLSAAFISKHQEHLQLRFLIRNKKIKRKTLQLVYG